MSQPCSYSRRWFSALTLLLLLSGLGGCTKQAKPVAATAGVAPTTAPAVAESPSSEIRATDELTIALESVRQMADIGGEKSAGRARFYLNQWLAKLDPTKTPWQADPLIKNLPASLRLTELPVEQRVPTGLEDLDRREFDAFDLAYLQHHLWLHDIATRVVREKPSPALAAWLKEVETSGAGVSTAAALAKAERLFDWTVRNIQLDPLLPPPKPPVATATASEQQRLFDSLPAPLRGEPGPGYQETAQRTLLIGHGDAWQRGRIFILLCREMGIDAAMLGVVDETSGTGAQPWAVAVLLKGQLYLFEPALGLPIPGPDLAGIATLEQAVAQPGLLAQLDLTDGPKYPVQQEQLTNVVALIDAEPHALSQRMRIIEASLKGNRRLALTCVPQALDKALRACKHISTVSLWRVPIEANMYQYGFAQRLGQNPALMAEYQREVAMFQSGRPLMQARNLHLEGVFSDADQVRGARTLYLASRPPDREIELLQTSNAMREQLALTENLPKDVKSRNAALDQMAGMARSIKHQATYWLALTYVEESKADAAIEWLEQRALPATPPTPWLGGVRYNLARQYEARGESEKARAYYLADLNSPQAHGNRLRAQWLAEK